MTIRRFAVLTIALAILPCTRAYAGFMGTELTLSTLGEATPSSPAVITSFPRVVTVSASTVEYPNVASLFNPNSPNIPGFARSLVNTAIDVGDDFITFDFDNAGFGLFASGFRNAYVFEFNSQALVNITGAHIDQHVTTLGLVPSDIFFAGNKLFVNVEGLFFSPNTFAKIDFDVEGGPSAAVPEPGVIALLVSGLLVVCLAPSLRRRVVAALCRHRVPQGTLCGPC